MMKKMKSLMIGLSLAIYMVVVLGLVSDKSSSTVCNSIHVHIMDSLENGILTNEEVMSMIRQSDRKILGYPIKEINTRDMEKVLKSHPAIKYVEIYKRVEGSLNIDIRQRKPILRMINGNQESYYIAEDGSIMPLSDKYTTRIVIANGYIQGSKDVENLLAVEGDSHDDLIEALYRIALYIEKNDFWRVQIEQLYVDRNGEVEIIPVVGAHIIKFGPPVEIERKFQKLLAFYEQGLNKIGWNRYQTINLKYEGQVVCTLR